jgi:hypothetical protein
MQQPSGSSELTVVGGEGRGPLSQHLQTGGVEAVGLSVDCVQKHVRSRPVPPQTWRVRQRSAASLTRPVRSMGMGSISAGWVGEWNWGEGSRAVQGSRPVERSDGSRFDRHTLGLHAVLGDQVGRVAVGRRDAWFIPVNPRGDGEVKS